MVGAAFFLFLRAKLQYDSVRPYRHKGCKNHPAYALDFLSTHLRPFLEDHPKKNATMGWDEAMARERKRKGTFGITRRGWPEAWVSAQEPCE